MREKMWFFGPEPPSDALPGDRFTYSERVAAVPISALTPWIRPTLRMRLRAFIHELVCGRGEES